MELSDIPTSQHLLVQYQQWKHQKNVRMYFVWCFHCYFLKNTCLMAMIMNSKIINV